jgi:hypothetical protein
MQENFTQNTLNSTTEKTVSGIRNLLLLPVDRSTIHKLRESVNTIRDQLQSEDPLHPSLVNEIVVLMQEVHEAVEKFINTGIRNIEGAPQLRHDLLLTIAILPDILDQDSEESISLTLNLELYEWLIKFKDSDNFDRKAKHPLSFSHVAIRALILFGLDKNNYYNVENIFRTIAVAVFRRQIHPTYFEYAAQYVRLKF